MKDPVPDGLCSRVVYKFVCADCNACYVGETCRRFSTLFREHLVTGTHIFKHPRDSAHCRALCSVDNFHGSIKQGSTVLKYIYSQQFLWLRSKAYNLSYC